MAFKYWNIQRSDNLLPFEYHIQIPTGSHFLETTIVLILKLENFKQLRNETFSNFDPEVKAKSRNFRAKIGPDV